MAEFKRDHNDAISGLGINHVLRQNGIVALVNLRGDHVALFPPGKIPPSLADWLNRDNGHRLKMLRNFLINLARGFYDHIS